MIKINGMNLDEFVENQVKSGCEVIQSANGVMNVSHGRTEIINGSVTIRKGDKTMLLEGKRIVKENGEWYVDGKKADTSSVGVTDSDPVTYEIHGDVQNLKTMSGNVTINGNCKHVHTTSGNVKCEKAEYVQTVSGDVCCDNIEGDVSTVSGDIYRRKY